MKRTPLSTVLVNEFAVVTFFFSRYIVSGRLSQNALARTNK